MNTLQKNARGRGIQSRHGQILSKTEILALKPTMNDDQFVDLLMHQKWLRCHKIQGISSTNAARARKFKKTFCEKCGATQKLLVHHINQNQFDNKPQNLMTLCSTCHNEHHRILNQRRAISG